MKDVAPVGHADWSYVLSYSRVGLSLSSVVLSIAYS